MRRGLGLSWLLLLAVVGVSLAEGGNWPGWRGDGSGTSADPDLPVTWGPDRNVLWKTPIEGHGISSPIVWEDRVFLTTAVEGSETAVSKLAVAAACGILSLLALIFGVWAVARARTKPGGGSSDPAWWTGLRWLDRAALALATLSFVSGLVVLLRSDRELTRVFEWIDHLVVTVPPGNVFRAWFFSGLVASLAAIAAVGSSRPASGWRAAGAAVLAGLGVYFQLGAPLDQHTQPIPAKVLVPVSGLLLLAAAWHLLVFLLARRRGGRPRPAPRARAVFALGILASAGVAYADANYMQPQTGLWREVVSIDLASGRILWQERAFMAPAGRKYRGNSYATPTAVTDGKHLLAHFGSGMVMMDLEGKVRWRKMIPEFDRYLRYGAGGSPVMTERLVIFAFMAEGGLGREGVWEGERSYLAALDKESGEEVWRVSPIPGGHDSYSTPLIVREGDRETVIISTYYNCLAYDANTGEARWRVRMPMEQPVPSLVADQETAYWVGGIHGPQAAAAIRLGGRGDISATHVRWKRTRGITGTSSPVLYDGLLYWVTEAGIAYCVDPETGEVIWRERLEGRYLGSPIAGSGRVYFPSLDGTVSVIEAGREFRLLAVNTIGEEIYASPAASRGKLLLRGRRHLFCLSSSSAS